MRWRCFFDLLLFQAKANLKAEISRLYLNYVWWVIEPCATMVIYYFVFGVFINQSSEHFILFLLIGTTQWQWFAATIQHSAMSIQIASGIFQHVDIPKVIFPMEIFIRDTFKHLFVMLLMAIFLLIYPVPIVASWVALPLLFILQGYFILTLCILVASLLPLLPDLYYIISTVLNLLIFVSGVFFDIDKLVLPQHRALLYANPIAGLLREYRTIIIGGNWPNWYYLGKVGLITTVLMLISLIIIMRMDKLYPRICQQ